MSDLIRGLIRWILVILLAILVIFLIIKIVNRSKVKAPKKQEPAPVVTIRDKEDVVVDNTQSDEHATLVVDTADTGATNKTSIIIGMLILGTTSYFIYKNKLEKE